MEYGLLLAVVALATVYLLRGDLPGDWFGSGGGLLSAPAGSMNSLDGAMGGAIKRTADQF